MTPVVDLEGEYGDVGHIYGKSSGLGPDLDLFGNPWIEDATMEWSNHAIALQASAEVMTHPLEDHKGGDFDSDMQMGVERCDVGVIGVTKDLEEPEITAICEKFLLVPHFEGEEDDQCETMDLLVGEHHPTQIEFPVVEIFNCALKLMYGCVAAVAPSVLNPLVDCVKFVEGLETRYDASTTRIPQFKPFSVGGTYEKGQGGLPSKFWMSIELPTIVIFDPGDFIPKTMHKQVKGLTPSVSDLPVSCVKFFEGAETPFLSLYRLVPFWATWTNGKEQIDVENLYRGCGLTLDDVGHLLRPPGCVFDGRWLKDIASPGLLVPIVDAHHMWLIYQVIFHFWTVGR